MPEPSSVPHDLHGEFVREMIEIDRAHEAGKLSLWLDERLADVRRAAENAN